MAGRGPAAVWLGAAAAGLLLAGALTQGLGTLSAAALRQDPDRRAPQIYAAGPVNTVHRSRPQAATNLAAAPALASLLLGQTNFLNR